MFVFTVSYLLVLDQTVNENDQTLVNNEIPDFDGGDAYIPDEDAGKEPLTESKADEMPGIDLNVSLEQEFTTQDSTTFTENHRYGYFLSYNQSPNFHIF